MATKSLKARNNDIANTEMQLEILSNGIFANRELPTFATKIKETNQFPLRPKKLEILQINLGYMCNQVCAHCHVDAGPDRNEIMTIETMNHCLEVIKKNRRSNVRFNWWSTRNESKFQMVCRRSIQNRHQRFYCAIEFNHHQSQ